MRALIILGGGNAGNFAFVPICYIKIVACKASGFFQIIRVNRE